MSDEHVHAEYEKDALLTILSETENLTNVGGWEWDVEKQTHFWTDEVYRIHDFQLNESKQGADWKWYRDSHQRSWPERS